MSMLMRGVPKSDKPRLKLILVGSSGVGKTCLISAFFHKGHETAPAPTVSPAYMFHEIRRPDGVQICLQIWDTAGQERYHSVSQLFYRDADVAFVCWEAGNDESLESVVDWVTKVRREVPDCMFVFVATKCDLIDEQHYQLVRATAQKMLASYQPKGIYLTSAVTRQGVDELFRAAAELYGAPVKVVTGPKPAAEQAGGRTRCCL